ncbi:MAG: hypothetical protein AAF431_01270 [Pseudomonadota bacterium]
MGKSLIAVGLLGLSLWFSYSCYEYAQQLKAPTQNQLSSWNVFHGEVTKENLAVDRDIAAIEAQLEYMVWPREAEKLKQQLLNLLRQKQNIAPYHARSALAYLAYQQQRPISEDERLWALQRAIVLNQWHLKQRPVLAYHCVDNEGILTTSLLAKCQDILTTLPKNYRQDYILEKLEQDRQRLDFKQG